MALSDAAFPDACARVELRAVEKEGADAAGAAIAGADALAAAIDAAGPRDRPDPPPTGALGALGAALALAAAAEAAGALGAFDGADGALGAEEALEDDAALEAVAAAMEVLLLAPPELEPEPEFMAAEPAFGVTEKEPDPMGPDLALLWLSE